MKSLTAIRIARNLPGVRISLHADLDWIIFVGVVGAVAWKAMDLYYEHKAIENTLNTEQEKQATYANKLKNLAEETINDWTKRAECRVREARKEDPNYIWIPFNSLSEAEEARSHLLDTIKTYGIETIIGFSNDCNLTLTDEKNGYGWTTSHIKTIAQTGVEYFPKDEKYFLVLPRPESIYDPKEPETSKE